MDLIYEGITTEKASSYGSTLPRSVRMDLIYEGITTIEGGLNVRVSHSKVRMDLIYEGITTCRYCGKRSIVCQNGPDLRRDYDGSELTRVLDER